MILQKSTTFCIDTTDEMWYNKIGGVNMANTMSTRLRNARKARGMSQDELASMIGTTRGVIINMERDDDDKYARKTPPQDIVVNAVCRALGITKEWLLAGTGSMVPEYVEPQIPRNEWIILDHFRREVSDLSAPELNFLFDTIQSLKRLRDK